jgi:hypothetical protein
MAGTVIVDKIQLGDGTSSFQVVSNTGTLIFNANLDGRVGFGTSTPEATLDVLANTATDAVRITQTGTGNALVVEDSANPDSTPFVINADGNLGIGTASPLANLQIGNGSSATLSSTAPYAWISARAKSTTNLPTAPQELLKLSWQEGIQDLGEGEGCAINFAASLVGDSGTFYNVAQIASFKENSTDTSRLSSLTFSTSADGIAAPTEQMRLTSTGDLRFNSGYGSVATAYGCRAWVNFNGTGTVAIRASGNVSSITDNGTGDYTVNFTTAMPDANYSAVATCSRNDSGTTTRSIGILESGVYSTTAVRVLCEVSNGTNQSAATVCIAIFR